MRVGRQTCTGGKQRAWTDDVRRLAAGAGEGRGAARCVAYEARGYKQAGQTDGRAYEARGYKQAGQTDGRAGRRASQWPKSSQIWLILLIMPLSPKMSAKALRFYAVNLLHSFICSSCQILLPVYLKNGLNNFHKTEKGYSSLHFKPYSSVHTDDPDLNNQSRR